MDTSGRKGDGSSKGFNFGTKTPTLQIRRGRYYDDQGRENTVKDGDLEITMTALQTLQTTTDKTGFDRGASVEEISSHITGLRIRPTSSSRFLHSNNFQRYFEDSCEDQPKFGWLALEWSRQHGYSQPSKRMIINGILTEVKNHIKDTNSEIEGDEKAITEMLE